MAETKYKAVVSRIQEETKKRYVFLDESILKDGITVDDIDKDYVLSLKHLLLPTKLHDDALKVLQKLGKTRADCMYGDTYLGDLIFSSVMQPEMKKCITALKKEECGKALTSLIGMFFVFLNEEGWIRDNESWMEKSFPKLFREYSLCWKIMLGSPNGETELIYRGGLPDGYKDKLLSLLQEQQDEVNNALADINDCFDEDQSNMCPRVDILPLPDVPLTVDNLPGRKPQSTTVNNAQSQRRKPKTKKPRKPTHFWFHSGDSAAHRNQIIKRYMAEWQEDVKKWEEENKEYLKPKRKTSKKQTEPGTSKKKGARKPTPASTSGKENVASNSSAVNKSTTKRKAETKPLVSKTSKKIKTSEKTGEEATSSGSSSSNANEGEIEEVVNKSSTVTRSGRKCNPVNRFV